MMRKIILIVILSAKDSHDKLPTSIPPHSLFRYKNSCLGRPNGAPPHWVLRVTSVTNCAWLRYSECGLSSSFTSSTTSSRQCHHGWSFHVQAQVRVKYLFCEVLQSLAVRRHDTIFCRPGFVPCCLACSCSKQRMCTVRALLI